jgi:hypothetical protein
MMIAGGFIWHIVRALRRSFGRIALLFLVTGLIAAIVVELVAIFESGGQFPSAPTHLIALVLGLAFAYACSATMLVVEIIRDLYLTVEEIERDFRDKFTASSKLVDDVVEGMGAGVMGSAVQRTFGRR